MAVHCSVKTTHSEGRIRPQFVQSSQVRGGGQSGVETRLMSGGEMLDKYNGPSMNGLAPDSDELLPTQTGETAFVASNRPTCLHKVHQDCRDGCVWAHRLQSGASFQHNRKRASSPLRA